jgi:mono/diheme cytochrome c family protein/plastocyanin
MKSRNLLPLLLVLAALALPLGALAIRNIDAKDGIEVHARVAEAGGWTPADLTVVAGEPLHLRLTSDDVLHGFAVGQSDSPAVDVPPGQVVDTTLQFNQPGKYVFYCTRWCGLSHWRMRGTIEVTGLPEEAPASEPPLYATLGLDLDAPHLATRLPSGKPSAARGASIAESDASIAILNRDGNLALSPEHVWETYRADPALKARSDDDLWDLVAWTWRSATTPEALAEGSRLYAENCAACHGEAGGGDGVMSASLAAQGHDAQREFGSHTQRPADFTDPASMLGASPALLQGKILRGGMGTGMPYWGPIFTDAQTWAIVDFLWSFPFLYEEVR